MLPRKVYCGAEFSTSHCPQTFGTQYKSVSNTFSKIAESGRRMIPGIEAVGINLVDGAYKRVSQHPGKVGLEMAGGLAVGFTGAVAFALDPEFVVAGVVVGVAVAADVLAFGSWL